MTIPEPTGAALPDAYPVELERTISLNDGSAISVRPVVPADVELLKTALKEADEATLYFRFFTPRPNIGATQLAYLTEVDYVWRMALVAFFDGHPIAIGRYEGSEGSLEAEFAIVVDPAWRGRGVADAVGKLLGQIAAGNGIKRLIAFYLAENQPAGAMLARLGFAEGTLDHGVITTTLDLEAAEPG